MKKFLLFSLATTLLLLACDMTINIQPPTATAGPTPTATSSSLYPWPDGAGSCMLAASTSQIVYDRPSIDANVFGETGDGFSAQVQIRTVDGWVGFDPGVAQAANIGIFRYRWLHFDQVALSGGCVAVAETTWVPEPTACYDMPMESVNVYTETDSSSDILATLEIEDFAAVLGFTGTGWAQIDLGNGNTGLSGIGWVEDFTLNLNGTLCDELPTVSP
jgi:hypothetical protein